MASCMPRLIRLVLIHMAPHETRDEVTRGGHAMKRSQHQIPNIRRTDLSPNPKARVYEGDGARRMVQQQRTNQKMNPVQGDDGTERKFAGIFSNYNVKQVQVCTI